MSRPGREQDETINLYVSEFQRRYPEFERYRRQEGSGFKEDFVSRMFTDRIVRGDKIRFDSLLQGMLTEEEHARLETDPRFTKAWRIFVDLCWIRRQVLRSILMIGGILLVFGLLIGGYFALPYFSAPQLP